MLCTSPSARRVGATFSTSDKVAITCPAQLSCSASQVSVWCCTFLSIHSAFTHSGTVDYPLFMVFTLLPYPFLLPIFTIQMVLLPVDLKQLCKKSWLFHPSIVVFCFVSIWKLSKYFAWTLCRKSHPSLTSNSQRESRVIYVVWKLPVFWFCMNVLFKIASYLTVHLA